MSEPGQTEARPAAEPAASSSGEPATAPGRSSEAWAGAVPMPPDAAVADDRERRLDPRWVQVERLGGSITTAILGGASLVGVGVATLAGAWSVSVAGIVLLGWLMACVLLAALVLTLPAIRYRYVTYRVSDTRVQIRRGVWFRSVVSVPRSRVQHTDVSQGPIERLWELSTLIIYTAGTQHASVHLPGLERATALRIRDHLLEVGDDDAV